MNDFELEDAQARCRRRTQSCWKRYGFQPFQTGTCEEQRTFLVSLDIRSFQIRGVSE